MHTEYIKLKHGYPDRIEAESHSVVYDDFEFRLTYHSEYGFGLQARDCWAGEDWVDVECLRDIPEFYHVFRELFHIDVESSNTDGRETC